MKPFRSLGLGLMVVLLVAGGAMAAGKSCKTYSNRKAKADGVNVDLGTIIYTDGSAGWKTYVKWPGSFYATGLRTTWNTDNLHTPGCNVVLKFKARLSGTRKYGVWRSKTNLITLSVIDENGGVLATKTINKKVGRPHTYNFTMPQFHAPCEGRDGVPLTLRLSFDKKDGASGDDGTCSFSFTVHNGEN